MELDCQKHRGLKIIISPAKKMKVKNDILPYVGQPVFLEKTKWLLEYMRGLSFDELQSIWKCNQQIAEENYERIVTMDLEKNLTPAILSYEGIQYKYMGPAVFEEKAYQYLEDHLYILSGFYGALRPFDGVTPYRLEMQARFRGEEVDSLYDYWGEDISKEVFDNCCGLVNLASKEYSKCVMKHLTEQIPCITCVFGELIGGKVKEKGTYAKMARGEMVRFMAENTIEDFESLKAFDRFGYRYSEDFSDKNHMVFIKSEGQNP